jgi:hypothetical protein
MENNPKGSRQKKKILPESENLKQTLIGNHKTLSISSESVKQILHL